MSGVRHGVHTTAELLHTAAWLDFQAYVRSLQDAGRTELASEVWASVVEVVHLPAPDDPVLDLPGLPALKRMPCVEVDCDRCRRSRSGFRFPWVGVWCRRAVLVDTPISPTEAWDRWHNDDQHLTLLEVQQLASGLQMEDIYPVAMDTVLSRTSVIPGCARRSSVFWAWRQWQQGNLRWVDPRDGPSPSKSDARAYPRSRAQASIRAWLYFSTENPTQYMPDICVGCGKASRRCCTGCIRCACVDCETCAGPPICCGEFAMGETARIDLPALELQEDQGRLARHLVARWAPLRSTQQDGPA